MRLLVVSDVHANAPAFEAVLLDAKRRGFDASLFLGDLVGYNPFPNECAGLLQELDPLACLLGNHDELLLGMLDDTARDVREESLVSDVVARHAEAIDADTVALLRRLRDDAAGPGWRAVHGAFRQPFEYMTTLSNAQANLPFLEERVGFVGHTHLPKVFASVEHAPTAPHAAGDAPLWRTVTFRPPEGRYRVPPSAKAFLNPGSVGQPRDGFAEASYALFDTVSVTFEVRRVPYDVGAVQRAIREAGYPEALAARLPLGR